MYSRKTVKATVELQAKTFYSELSQVIVGSHVAPLSVLYSIRFGIVLPMKENCTMGPAPDRPIFWSEMESVRLRSHF